MKMRVVCWVCAMCAWGCVTDGDDVEPLMLTEVEPPEPVIEASCAEPGAPGFSGTLYVDQDVSSTTTYSQSIDEGDSPLEGAIVRLIRREEVQAVLSCEDGTFRFPEARAGWHMLELAEPVPQLVTSSNQARRLPAAVREGSVKVVTFGDSIPAYGPQPWFPERLRVKLTEVVAEVNVENVAVPGTTTLDWLPSSTSFSNDLSPKLEGADVIVFSLGGNDLYAFAETDLASTPVDQLIADFEGAVEDIKSNLKTIITELRRRNPDADIVWLLYPNYARSTEWQNIAGNSVGLLERVLKRTLGEIREDMAHHEGLIVWDMFGGTQDVDLNTILIDPLHLNSVGHELYANALFETLGGVLIAEQDGSEERSIGVSLD